MNNKFFLVINHITHTKKSELVSWTLDDADHVPTFVWN